MNNRVTHGTLYIGRQFTRQKKIRFRPVQKVGMIVRSVPDFSSVYDLSVLKQARASQARAAERQANKEKAEEEKARKKDNEQQTKELLEISDENMVWIFLSPMNTL